jgi:hypothetical protein
MGGSFTKVTPNILLTSEEFPELFNKTFNVERTNKDKEDGWTLPDPETGHLCYNACIHKPWALKDINGKWRIFLVGLSDPDKHSCGWRRVESFSPSNGWADNDVTGLIAKLEAKLTQIPQSEIDEFETETGITFNSHIKDNIPAKVNQDQI